MNDVGVWSSRRCADSVELGPSMWRATDARIRFPAAFCDDPDEPRTASCPRVSTCMLQCLHLASGTSSLRSSRFTAFTNHPAISQLRHPPAGAHRHSDAKGGSSGKLLANHSPAHPRHQQRGTCALPAAVNTTQTWDWIKTSLLWSPRRDESSGRHVMYKHEAILTSF